MIIQRKEKQPDESYERYVYLQGHKYRNRIDEIQRNNHRRTKAFKVIFERMHSLLIPGRILCLGARTGCEVRAARQVGYKGSIGIDLYPAPDRDEVIYGDWHSIPFQDEAFENVYTNSLDHCYAPDKLIQEVHRVLVLDGRFFFQTMVKEDLKSQVNKEEFVQEKIRESMDYLFWDTGKELARYFEGFGFRIAKKQIDKKWESFVLKKVNE